MRPTFFAALATVVTAATVTVARNGRADPPAVAPATPTAVPTPEYKAPIVRPYEGGVIPPGAHLETRWNKDVFLAGVAVAGTAYLPSLLYALQSCGLGTSSDASGPPVTGGACRSGSAWLYVPIVGPYVTATQAPTTGGATLSVFDGVVQTIGAGLMLAAVIMPRTVVVWQDLAGSTSVRVTPVAAAGGGGIAVTATSL